MADVKAARPPGGRMRQQFRPDRVYLGWQYTLMAGDPGPPPRRPTPPEQEPLSQQWVAAQRREENMLNRPLKVTFGLAIAFAAMLATMWVTGLLVGPLAGFGLIVCLAGAVISGHAIWQGEQALRSTVTGERQRLGKIRTEQESRLFAWQEEHKRRFEQWQQRRAAFESQLQWYAVSLPDAVDRIDVAGGTLVGWSALSTVLGASRLSAGGEVTFVDLSEGAAAAELVSVVQGSGIDPLVWVLPADLPRLDIGTGLGKEELADVLSLLVSVMEEHGSTRDLSYDNAILERVLDALDGHATIAKITAALRALAQVGDPRDDVKLGLIGADQVERLATMFGRGAADRIVVERAFGMESQLRKLAGLGSAPASLSPSPLRVVSTDRRAGVFGNKVLGTFVVTALTHMLRQAPAGQPWQHTVCLLGAEKLRADVLDRLCDACEQTRTGLVVAYRSIPSHVRERLGRGNAAVAFMRLGNAEDANAASEQIGTEQRFVLSQLTETIGTEVTDSIGDSYTSTVGTSDGVSTSISTTSTDGRSQGRGLSRESVLMPFGHSTRSRSRDVSHSYATSDSDTISEGMSRSTAWGVNTSRAVGASQSLARSSQRSREFLVEQHELQQLPPSAVIITHAARDGRRVVLADANPAILALPTATLLSLEEVQLSSQAAPAHGRPAGGHGEPDAGNWAGPGSFEPRPASGWPPPGSARPAAAGPGMAAPGPGSPAGAGLGRAAPGPGRAAPGPGGAAPGPGGAAPGPGGAAPGPGSPAGAGPGRAAPGPGGAVPGSSRPEPGWPGSGRPAPDSGWSAPFGARSPVGHGWPETGADPSAPAARTAPAGSAGSTPRGPSAHAGPTTPAGPGVPGAVPRGPAGPAQSGAPRAVPRGPTGPAGPGAPGAVPHGTPGPVEPGAPGAVPHGPAPYAGAARWPWTGPAPREPYEGHHDEHPYLSGPRDEPGPRSGPGPHSDRGYGPHSVRGPHPGASRGPTPSTADPAGPLPGDVAGASPGGAPGEAPGEPGAFRAQPPEPKKNRTPKPVGWHGEDRPPPNLGPPPPRLDWRKRPRKDS